jgi:hypothetical protein
MAAEQSSLMMERKAQLVTGLSPLFVLDNFIAVRRVL